MRSFIIYIIYSRATRICISLAIGYGIWSIMHHTVEENITISMPIIINNNKENTKYEIPKTIPLTVKGTRSTLQTIQNNSCSITLNGSILTPGINFITLAHTTLSLPPSVSVVNYSSVRIPVIVKEMI